MTFQRFLFRFKHVGADPCVRPRFPPRVFGTTHGSSPTRFVLCVFSGRHAGRPLRGFCFVRVRDDTWVVPYAIFSFVCVFGTTRGSSPTRFLFCAFLGRHTGRPLRDFFFRVRFRDDTRVVPYFLLTISAYISQISFTSPSATS